MEKFAAHTSVDVGVTRGNINSIIAKYGGRLLNVDETVPGRAVIMFQSNHRSPRFLRVVLNFPVGVGAEQRCRTKWRALYNDIKFKFVSIDEGIETFDQAFMAWIIGPSGKTLYETARSLRLLPPPEAA